jgi:hypothetical protein
MLRSPLSSPLRSPLSSPLAARRGGGAPSFDPATLFASGELGGWYDPSDLSTLFQDTAGTVPVTAAGQAVARINDKSGNVNHLTQATPAARPLYQTGGGLHWLDFDGTDDFMASAAGKTVDLPVYVCLAFRRINNAERNLFGIVRNGVNFMSISNSASPGVVSARISQDSFPLVRADGSSVSIGQDAVCDSQFSVGSQDIAINGGSPVSSINSWSGSTSIVSSAYGISLFNNAAGQTITPLRFYGGIILENNASPNRESCQRYLGEKAGVFF